MAARQNYYQESTGTTTTTDANETTKVTLTFTPDANSDYLYIASALVQGVTTEDAQVRVRNDGGTALNEWNIEFDQTSNWQGVFGNAKESFGASPTEQDITLTIQREGANNCSIKEARLFALKLDSQDEYAEDLSETSIPDDTAFNSMLDLVFTPASEGDYLIIGSCEDHTNNANSRAHSRIFHSSTGYGEQSNRPQDITNYEAHGYIVKLSSLAASSQTISIQGARTAISTGTQTLRKLKLVALRLDQFANNYYQESRTGSNTTSSIFQDKTTLSYTPNSGNHLILGTAHRWHSSSLSEGTTKLRDGSGDLIAETAVINTSDGNRNSGHPGAFFQMLRRSESGGSIDLDLAYASTNNTTQTDIDEAAIAVIELQEPGVASVPGLSYALFPIAQKRSTLLRM